MLDLQLADEPDAIGEAVVEQQHESMEVEQRIAVRFLVEMQVHAAGQRTRYRRVVSACLAERSRARRQRQNRDSQKSIDMRLKTHILMSHNMSEAAPGQAIGRARRVRLPKGVRPGVW